MLLDIITGSSEITCIKKDNSWYHRHSQFSVLAAFIRRHYGSLTWNRRNQIGDEWLGFFGVFFWHMICSGVKGRLLSFIFHSMGYMFFINIQPDHNMASTWILIKVTEEIKSGSTKRHKKNIPVLYFCFILIDQNKQCTENQIRCLTSVYKGTMQNIFQSYPNENKYKWGWKKVEHKKAYSDDLMLL